MTPYEKAELLIDLYTDIQAVAEKYKEHNCEEFNVWMQVVRAATGLAYVAVKEAAENAEEEFSDEHTRDEILSEASEEIAEARFQNP
jgi:hypothetical protein